MKPILNNYPNIIAMIAESPRLYIRQLTPGDMDHVFHIYSDKEAMKFRSNKPLERIEEAGIMIENATDKINKQIEFRYAVVLKNSETLIGTFLYKQINVHTWEVGYSLGRRYWRYGYGFELLITMINFLLNKGIRSIIARTKKENIASMRLLEKAGFVFVESKVNTGFNLYQLKYFPVQLTAGVC